MDHKQLDVWKKSMDLVVQVYQITNLLPDTEKFGLTSQIRRAAVSVPSNIAEGYSRTSNKDFARFLQITLGSSYEIGTQLLIASDLKFISELELHKISKENAIRGFNDTCGL